jgi:hypothetical protein
MDSKIGSLSTSYDAANQRIASEQRLNHRLEWVSTRPELARGPGCEVSATGSAVCDLMAKNGLVLSPTSVSADAPTEPGQDICLVPIAGVGTPTADTIKALKPLQRADVIASLKTYAAALLAVTKAQDRADFDAASGKASAAVGGLVQSAALASGTAAAAAAPLAGLAKASADIALWLIGQELDHKRLEELRAATETACEPVHALAIALAFMLEEQRGDELQLLRQQLEWNIRAVNQLRQQGSAQSYGAAIDAAEASADAFQNIHVTDPDALSNALRDAHDQLVLAVRNNTGQGAALIASLNTFAKYVDQLETAAHNVSETAPTAAGKKS